MKIIGVEFRVGLQHAIVGAKQFEVFLHPVEIEFEKEYANNRTYPFANFTVHTNLGDATTDRLSLPCEMEYKNVAEADLKIAWERFERQFSKVSR